MAKRGRPTEYTDDLPEKLRTYANDCLNRHQVPWLEEFCHKNDISERTLREWCKVHDDMEEAKEYLMTIQKMILKQLCITKGAHVAGAIFLLKANHGLIETDRVQHASSDVEPLNIIFTDVATWKRHKENVAKRQENQTKSTVAQSASPSTAPEAVGGYDWNNYLQNPC